MMNVGFTQVLIALILSKGGGDYTVSVTHRDTMATFKGNMPG